MKSSALHSSVYFSSVISAMISSRAERRVAALSSENTRGLLNLSTLSYGPSDWSKMWRCNNTVTSLTYPLSSRPKIQFSAIITFFKTARMWCAAAVCGSRVILSLTRSIPKNIPRPLTSPII